MEYQPEDRTDRGDGCQEWKFEFSRHGLKCEVTISAWPNGNWGWQSLIDARGLGLTPPPALSEVEILSRALCRPGPQRLSAMMEIGGLCPSLSLPETLKMALGQIDQLYAEAEKE